MQLVHVQCSPSAYASPSWWKKHGGVEMIRYHKAEAAEEGLVRGEQLRGPGLVPCTGSGSGPDVLT